MPILERKIAHKMTTLCSHMTYPELVLPLHKHAEYQLIFFTHGSGKQFVGEGVAPYAEGDVALIGSNVPHLHLCKSRMKSGENAGKGKQLYHEPYFSIGSILLLRQQTKGIARILHRRHQATFIVLKTE